MGGFVGSWGPLICDKTGNNKYLYISGFNKGFSEDFQRDTEFEIDESTVITKSGVHLDGETKPYLKMVKVKCSNEKVEYLRWSPYYTFDKIFKPCRRRLAT